MNLMMMKYTSSCCSSSTITTSSLSNPIIKFQLIFLYYLISNTIAIVDSSITKTKNSVTFKNYYNSKNKISSSFSGKRRSRSKSRSKAMKLINLFVTKGSRTQKQLEAIYGVDEDSIVRFYLYSNPYQRFDNAEEIHIGDFGRLKASNYNPKHPLIILIHGFLSNATYFYGEIDRIREAYIETKTKANIIGVDYAALASPAPPILQRRPLTTLYYGQAISNIPLVGSQITEFILFLLNVGYLSSLQDVHLVGFSMGAHCAGYVGTELHKRTGHKLGRITGLDPAGFLFYHRNKNNKLDPSDAKFVDVTHTAIGVYGLGGSLGHVDYFVNGGGPKQPGCVKLTNPTTLVDSCSHNRAYAYYAESIRNPHIVACKCTFCQGQKSQRNCYFPVSYGEHVDQRVRGNFHVQIQLQINQRFDELEPTETEY